MKIIIFFVGLMLCLCKIAYPAEGNYYAWLFAKEYENEIRAQAQQKKELIEKTRNWKVDVNVKTGVATYRESEQTVRSDWDAFYTEATANLTRESENEIESALGFSFGRSAEETETWYISDIKYQTNDLDFYRLNLKGSVGKILYSDKYKDLRVVPFLGYGFRLIGFERTNFNILNTITSREVVTEKYYIHHIDAGLRLDKPLTEKWGISVSGLLGYVFYNQADNSALGKIDGSGGYLVDGNINLIYSLTNSSRLIFGGFVEKEDLKGGEKGDIIWPDNDLDIYGGNIGVKFIF